MISILTSLIEILKTCLFFTTSYSNNVFPDPLTKEEEEEYVKRANLGDSEARNKLIEHNLRLVAHIVKKYDHKKEEVDDLISIGTIGLIKGVDSYSNKHGTRITTYCARCIEPEILLYFRTDKKNNKNISLNEQIGFDILKTPDPDYALEIHKQNNIKLIDKDCNVLNDREKEIIIKRYGLNDTDELTQKEIASSLGISRSYVSRIEKRALTKMLREFIKNKDNSET